MILRKLQEFIDSGEYTHFTFNLDVTANDGEGIPGLEVSFTFNRVEVDPDKSAVRFVSDCESGKWYEQEMILHDVEEFYVDEDHPFSLIGDVVVLKFRSDLEKKEIKLLFR